MTTQMSLSRRAIETMFAIAWRRLQLIAPLTFAAQRVVGGSSQGSVAWALASC